MEEGYGQNFRQLKFHDKVAKKRGSGRVDDEGFMAEDEANVPWRRWAIGGLAVASVLGLLAVGHWLVEQRLSLVAERRVRALEEGERLQQEQDRKLDAIERLGGRIQRDPQPGGASLIRVTIPSSSSVSDEDIAAFKEIPQLWRLDIDAARLKGNGLAHLKDLPMLQELNLGGEISDAGLVPLGELTGLSSLSLASAELTDGGLEPCAKLKNLEALRLRCPKMTDKALEHLQSLGNLRVLEVRLSRITARGVNELQKKLPGLAIRCMPPLEPLAAATLKDRGWKYETDRRDPGAIVKIIVPFPKEVTEADLEAIVEVAGVRDLVLSQTNFSGQGLGLLNRLQHLESLTLGLGTTDSALATMKELTTLRQLTIVGSRVSDAGLEHLKGLKRLEKLVLKDTSITDEGLQHLIDLPELRELQLRGSAVTDGGLKNLRDKKADLKVARLGPRQ